MAVTSPSKQNHDGTARKSKFNLPQNFSDFDRHQFSQSSYEGTLRKFEENIKLVGEEDPSYQGIVQVIDSKKFESKLFKNGKLVARCIIKLGSSYGGDESLMYSSGVNISLGENSYNDMLSVSISDNKMFLTSQSFFGVNDNMSGADASEYLWNKFISEVR